MEQATAAGHQVAVFHRGRTNPDLLAGRVEHRLGDRDTGDYSSLAGAETWDAVVDVTAYVPRHVHQLADVLAGRAGYCVHVSSVSAYDLDRATIAEDSPLYPDPPSAAEVGAATYGPLKAACERAAVERFGPRSTAVVRPAYVCGAPRQRGQLHLLGVIDDPRDAVISIRPGVEARRAGLTTRSASETAEATRGWDDARGRPPLEVGPSRAQEAALPADLGRRR